MENSIRILIIEDEALIAEDLRLTLEELGYVVTGTCYSFADAKVELAKKNMDLVILDINLGDPNGEQGGMALAEIIRTGPKVPFIFLTAYSDQDTIRQATRLRPSGYLIKPVNTAALFAAIQTAIEANPQEPPVPQGPSEYFFVRMGSRSHRVSWNDVYCVEAGKNYVTIRLINSKTHFPLRGTINFVISQLMPTPLQDDFIRINRSTSINKRFITSYTASEVYCMEERFENTKFTIRELRDLTS
jgi:two-component system, LytTR family, response regulator LytT